MPCPLLKRSMVLIMKGVRYALTKPVLARIVAVAVAVVVATGVVAAIVAVGTVAVVVATTTVVATAVGDNLNQISGILFNYVPI